VFCEIKDITGEKIQAVLDSEVDLIFSDTEKRVDPAATAGGMLSI
jgi:hypothetical protein